MRSACVKQLVRRAENGSERTNKRTNKQTNKYINSSLYSIRSTLTCNLLHQNDREVWKNWHVGVPLDTECHVSSRRQGHEFRRLATRISGHSKSVYCICMGHSQEKILWVSIKFGPILKHFQGFIKKTFISMGMNPQTAPKYAHLH